MKTLQEIKLGTPVLIHYKDGRPSEWFEWGGFTFDKETVEKTADKDGYSQEFVMFGKPIRETKGIILPDGEMCYVMLFPHTIERIEVKEDD